jgi:DNA invertase Pin-like site-specific DNA recombinase
MAKVEYPMNNDKRAVAYLRVSTDEQHLGPEAQRATIQQYAKQHGIEIVAEFCDFGVSGGAELEDRPELMCAIDALTELDAGLFLVAKRDRLARSTMFAAIIEENCKKNGGRVHSADGLSNDDTPEAKLMRTLLDAFAEYERSLIRSRTKAALRVKKARGEFCGGKVPFGYRNENGKLVEDEQQMAAAVRIRELHASGVSLRKIADALTTEGYPHPCGRWNHSTVARCIAAE